MLIIPAVDIMDGKVVRLYRGDFKKQTVYSDNPRKIAKDWQRQGARFLHLVDLDGALMGECKNLELVIDIAKSLKIPVEFSGGLRKLDLIERALKNGINRVVVGTRALDFAFLKKAVKKFKERICVSIDQRKAGLATSGWTKTKSVNPLDLIKQLENLGVSSIIYTDILRDGTLKGPNLKGASDILKATDISLIASGGISCLDDLRKLKSLSICGRRLAGVIIGKALYEKRFTLKDALKIART